MKNWVISFQRQLWCSVVPTGRILWQGKLIPSSSKTCLYWKVNILTSTKHAIFLKHGKSILKTSVKLKPKLYFCRTSYCNKNRSNWLLIKIEKCHLLRRMLLNKRRPTNNLKKLLRNKNWWKIWVLYFHFLKVVNSHILLIVTIVK